MYESHSEVERRGNKIVITVRGNWVEEGVWRDMGIEISCGEMGQERKRGLGVRMETFFFFFFLVRACIPGTSWRPGMGETIESL